MQIDWNVYKTVIKIEGGRKSYPVGERERFEITIFNAVFRSTPKLIFFKRIF